MFSSNPGSTNNRFASATLPIPLLLLLWSLSSIAGATDRVSNAEYPWQLDLTGATGQDFHLSDYRGKTLLVSFFYTTCGFACPMQTARLAKAQQLLNSESLNASRFVSISIHPERDTPQRIDAFMRPFGIDENHWQFGTPKNTTALNQLLVQAGVKTLESMESNQTDHTMKILLIDPSGKVMQRYVGNKFNVQRVANEVETLVRLRARG